VARSYHFEKSDRGDEGNLTYAIHALKISVDKLSDEKAGDFGEINYFL
jgi:hypothetical protein